MTRQPEQMLSLGPSSCSAWRSTRKPGQEWQLAQAIADWRLFGEPNRDSVHVIEVYSAKNVRTAGTTLRLQPVGTVVTEK
jgi:hypothetical protein